MATAAIGEHPKGMRLLRTALGNRKTAIMLVFGFAAGLPYTLLIGTLNAWLGEWEIDLATIGVLSWIGLAYAFKFLWSPLVDRVRLPGLEKLGRRRSWLLLCQVLLTLTFFGLSMSDPRLALGSFALVAVIGAFASATQDVVIDAWRIDVADEKAPVEILSSIYQFGYRIAALIGGALALVLSERVPLADGLCDHGRVHGADHHRDPDGARHAAHRGRESSRARFAAAARSSPKYRGDRARDRRASAGRGRSGWSAASWSRMLSGAVDPATGKPPVGRRLHQALWARGSSPRRSSCRRSSPRCSTGCRHAASMSSTADDPAVTRWRARRRPCLFGADPAAWRAGAAHRLGRDHRPRPDPQLPHHRQYLGLVRLPLLPSGAEVHRRRSRLRVEDLRRVHDHGRDRHRRASCSRRSGGCRPC